MADLILIACVIFAVTDWLAVAREWRHLEYVAKPATLALLLLYAATAPVPSWWLIAALAFSLLGDVYLMLPDDLFLAGLSAFLLAHVAYIVEFDAPVLARAAWTVAVLAVSFPLTTRMLRSIDQTALRVAVGSYMLVIALMVGSAIAAGHPIAIAGALLFFASDTLIGWSRFVRSFPWIPTAIIATYHLGQLGLVYALRG